MITRSKIKYIQSLQQKKYREEAGVFIGEGPKVVGELLIAHNIMAVEVFALEEWAVKNRELVHTDLTIVSEPELEKISGLVTPKDVVALFNKPSFSPGIIPECRISILLDGIQDPGNLGTIIRTADWFGVELIFCSPDTADNFNSKVVQSTMGSIGRVKVNYTELTEVVKEHQNIPVFVAALDGENLFQLQAPSEAFLVIGNESKGVSEAVMQLASHKVRIPGKGKAESLNAAVAAGIILSRFCV
ncbi:MAG: TrmH family RNA methyltransferase [Flavitalea sp.]